MGERGNMDTTHKHQRVNSFSIGIRCALVVCLAAILFLSISIPTAYATPSSVEMQAQADEASAKLAAAEAEMTQIGEDYKLAVEAHDAAVLAMDEAQARVEGAEAIIAKTQELLGARANQSYKEGPLSFVNVILGASSFAEFATSWDFIDILNRSNAQLIQVNKDARAEAEAAREEYSVQEQAAAERLAEAEAAKIKAEELVVEQKALLDGLNAEVAALVEQEQATRYAAAAEAAESSAGRGHVSPGLPPGGYGDVVSAAASRVGCSYVYGGNGPNVFDCSGFTSWCYAQAGRGSIGRSDFDQFARASVVWNYSAGGAAPGDVLWWPGHVGIYVGGGSYIHAANENLGVCYSSWNIDNAKVLRF